MSCRKVLHCSVVIVCINIEPRAPSFHCADKYNAMEAHAQPTCPFGCVPLSHTPLHSTWFSTATRCTPEMLCMAIKASEREVLASSPDPLNGCRSHQIPLIGLGFQKLSMVIWNRQTKTERRQTNTGKGVLVVFQRCSEGVLEYSKGVPGKISGKNRVSLV